MRAPGEGRKGACETQLARGSPTEEGQGPAKAHQRKRGGKRCPRALGYIGLMGPMRREEGDCETYPAWGRHEVKGEPSHRKVPKTASPDPAKAQRRQRRGERCPQGPEYISRAGPRRREEGGPRYLLGSGPRRAW
ncbi:hypothetical protein NDU88_002807 [Pleurodeles waltl]|uniref:Uncharacterized protein n=1 Tax=Pleurodeles waltl TaxID=8319 RepID=A0AAV7QB19_PLEWA|nr:hypothetical protein NDU88_002807 [Pleurodeles waltl]